jgi:competence protein ComGC
LKNERGLTLVELLSAITILFIISAIIYSVFFGFNKNYSQISEKNSMDQTANIIIATVKQHHLKYDQYKISYDEKKKTAYIGEKVADKLLGDTRYDLEIEIGYPNAGAISGSKNIDSSLPLSIHLTLNDKTGQTYEVKTIIKRY